MKLDDKITAIKGVGDKKAQKLSQLNIEKIEDLFYLIPRKYEDRRNVSYIMEAPFDREVLIKGKVVTQKTTGNPYSNKTPLRVLIEDSSATLEVLFFNAKYLKNYFKVGKEYTFYGKITLNNGRRQMAHPEFHPSGDKDDIRGIFPVYPLTDGITQSILRKLIKEALPLADEIKEWLPPEVVSQYSLCDPAYAIRNLHFPEDERQINEAKYRMIFEELLTLQTGLLYIKKGIADNNGIAIKEKSAAEFISSLSFELTEGQKKVWKEIENDLASDKPMNRLVQGDVGSGKTAVAEIAMFKTVINGFQAVMMAPTELLAKQHYASLKRDFKAFGFNVDLLCSSMNSKEKETALLNLKSGKTDIIVGTHALIQPNVKFNNLGLVITDEQHRFGVNQRSILTEKGINPNVLVMTATPIPRTLAVILYGDLDISVINTMPAGRMPIKTYLRNEEARDSIYSFVEKNVRDGRQAYVVAPLIEESEKLSCKSAEELFEEISRKFPHLRVGLVHGALKQEDKDRVMESFSLGKIDILVSTVVIEVGIDVPNATVMVIENCERFGLAQLHQLRGRVGRGKHQSYCILISGSDSKVAAKRNEIMVKSSDGFEIAEEDLKLRGPGEIFGTRQHGIPELNISNLLRHVDILENVKNVANNIIKKDPNFNLTENQPLKKKVQKMFGENIQLNL